MSFKSSKWVWAVLALLVCAVAVFIPRPPEPPHTPQAPAIVAPQSMPPFRGPAGLRTNLGSGVDLNTASLSQLETLPGMTPDYAHKIIAGRPFHDRKELVRAGIPAEVFNRMSPPAYLKFDLPGGIPPQ